jgi:hypothetical protein
LSETLRSYRRNAVHVRQALELLTHESGQMHVERGYLQDAGVVERYKRLSIPVRRALNAHDRASFAQALAALMAMPAGSRPPIDTIQRDWSRLQAELDSLVGLGGSKVPRRQILAGWLDAAAFYDTLDRDHAYDQLIDQWGKAAEAIGAQLTEEAARVILVLDEAAAAALDEPVILPPPPKTPPPPPDPKPSLWQRIRNLRIWGSGDLEN